MKNLLSNDTRAARQRGMTLIEILVAVVVLSVGLLGLAGLQLKGMQVNQGSAYRLQAATLVEDIADRMRADRANALAGAYTLAPGAAPSGGGAGTALAVSDWQARVATLPGGVATILNPVATAAGPTQIGISVSWTDTRAQGGAGVSSKNSPTTYATSGSYSVTVDL
jgi:type IV pilus assembly protein PilV